MPKICVLCGGHIPRQITVDGKKRNLKSRTKCLECLPFGTSVYRRKTPEEKRTHNAERVRKWYWQCRAKGYDPTNDRKVRNRKAILQLINGCQICGYDRAIRNLVFHHLENNKEFGLDSRIFSCSLNKLLPELRKCIIICHNCHGEIHDDMIEAKRISDLNKIFNFKLDVFDGMTWKEMGAYLSGRGAVL